MQERPTPTIRPATRAEIPEISGLIADSLETFRAVISNTLLDLYIHHSCDVVGRWDDTDVLVIEADGSIAGTVTYVDRRRKAEDGLPAGWSTFRTLAVHPKASGRGFGRVMVNHCVDSARAGGASVLGLYSADFMVKARGLYKRAGFVRSPQYDFLASSFFAFDPSDGDVVVTAYRLDL